MAYKAGIYKISNVSTGKIYIGATKNLTDRRSHHFSDLRGGRHANKHIQSAFNMYGESTFSWSVMLYCHEIDLTYYEQKMLDLMKPKYNILKESYTTHGYRHTESAKKKIANSSRSRKRRRWTEDEKRAQSLRLVGKTYPNREQQIAKITAKTRGKQRSLESIERYRRSKLGNEYGSKSYDIVAPDGRFFKVKNLKKFCRENGIDYHIRERHHWKGWFVTCVS